MKATKKMAAFAAAAVLAGAGAAHAATYEVNLAGASAQYDFWGNAAPSYMGASGLGCTVAAVHKDGNNKYLDYVGTGCTGVPGGTGNDTVVFRYAAKASYFGFPALNSCADTSDVGLGASSFTDGVSPDMLAITPTATMASNCQAAANGSLGAGYRWYLDSSYPAKKYGICLPVNVATADVPTPDFVQSTLVSYLQGPMGNASTTRSFPNYPTGTTGCMNPPAGSVNASPIVVPFGFIVNKCVAVNKCVNDPAHVAANKIGQLCSTDTDCGSGTAGTAPGVCSWTDLNATATGATYNPNTITDMSREMAVCIFSGACKNWEDFGDYFADQAIVACHRFSGSGTAASLDWQVMKPTVAGIAAAGLSNKQVVSGNVAGTPHCNQNYGTYPYAPYGTVANALTGTYVPSAQMPESGEGTVDDFRDCNLVWFNDGTPDAINCVAGNSIAHGSFVPAMNSWTNLTANTGACIGAVGYVDYDKSCTASTPSNVKFLTYNGYGYAGPVDTALDFNNSVNPRPQVREQIRNGRYEFASDEVMYWVPGGSYVNPYNGGNTTAGSIVNGIVSGLDTFAANPANLNVTNVGTCRNAFWAARDEMAFTKAAGKTGAFPHNTGAAIPQEP